MNKLAIGEGLLTSGAKVFHVDTGTLSASYLYIRNGITVPNLSRIFYPSQTTLPRSASVQPAPPVGRQDGSRLMITTITSRGDRTAAPVLNPDATTGKCSVAKPLRKGDTPRGLLRAGVTNRSGKTSLTVGHLLGRTLSALTLCPLPVRLAFSQNRMPPLLYLRLPY